MFSRSDCDPGRGGCPGGLQEAPGAAGDRPEAAGGGDFDPDGKTRGFGGPGAPKHRKFAYKSGGPEGCSGGPNVRVTVGKPTFRFSRCGRSDGLGGRIRWVRACFTVYFDTRSGSKNRPLRARGVDCGSHLSGWRVFSARSRCGHHEVSCFIGPIASPARAAPPRKVSKTRQRHTGGKPSTWFPSGRLVEQDRYVI